MCANGIALLDGGREARTNDRAAGVGVRGAPGEPNGFDTMLIWVGCRKNSEVNLGGGGSKIDHVLVRLTRPGYNNFSRSFSVPPIVDGGVLVVGAPLVRDDLDASAPGVGTAAPTKESVEIGMGVGSRGVAACFAPVSVSSWWETRRALGSAPT